MAALFWGCIFFGMTVSAIAYGFYIWKQEVRKREKASQNFKKIFMENNKTK